MLRNRLVRLAILACPLAPAAEAATVQHYEPLRLYRVQGVQHAGAQKPATAAPTTLSFNAFSRDFTLDLEPNGRLAAMQEQLELAPGTAAYRGKVAGRPDSWVRIVLTPAGPSGIVFDGDTLYGIETAGAGAAADGPVMFRLADVYFAPGELACEGGIAGMDGVQALAALKDEFPVAAAGATLNLNVGAVADFEFSQRFPGTANSALMTRFNSLDGLYSQQLGVQLTVEQTDIFTADGDPFTKSVAGELLEELAIYRGATPSQDAQGLTHLFTGRNLDGSTVGVAYTGAVCATRNPLDVSGRSFGAGLSQSSNSSLIDTLVAAHEIGHNFGAPHDGDGDCASTPSTGFIMAPSVDPLATSFSACSIQEMQAEIAGASCLTPMGPANMAVTLPQTPQLQGGVSSSHTVTVRNKGANDATGVSFTATADAPLTIVAINETGGSACTAAAQAASCTLNTVGGGGSRTVTLTLRSETAGTFDLTASVDADADADATDDERSVAVTVVPAVDLVWSGSSPGVQLNAQTTVTAVLDNASDFAASNVAVTATLTAGLRGDGASLGGAACAIAGQAITCPTRSVAARTNVALVVEATGTAVGPEQMTLSVTATEAERAPASNQLAIAVVVSAPPAEDGGGGGALTWWFVLALLAACGMRGRRELGRRRPS